MKKATGCKRIKAAALSIALMTGVVIPQGMAPVAAKLPSITKTVKVNVGATKVIKLKNVKSKAKVKWSSKNKKIAKITKKARTQATVRGVKEGKTKIVAKYTYRKIKKNLTCTVSVKDNKKETTPAPVETAVQSTPVQSPAATSLQASTNAPTAAPMDAPTVAPTDEPTATPEPIWVTTWGTAEEKNDISADTAMPKFPLEDSTIRQIIRVTTSGDKIKFRLTNEYGGSDVVVKSMHIAKQVEPDKPDIDVDTDTVVTVGGKEEFTIPKGKLIETDGVDFKVEALENVAVSMYFGEAPANNITGHRGARATTYQVEGNEVSSETLKVAYPKNGNQDAKPLTAWFFLADISLLSPYDSRAVVCFGDSITDGYGTDASYLGKKPDSYTRWGDYFAKRLQANENTKHVSVINEGIGSNGMLGSYPTDAGKDRFKRDLLEHDGVEYCIILFGVNDLNKLQNTDVFDKMKPEYENMVALCHKNGIKVYGAPILPFGTSDYYNENSEKVRTMINEWMRNTAESKFDGIINFDEALADPDNPVNIKEEYTHADGLHPYDGYDVMANAIDLTLFEE